MSEKIKLSQTVIVEGRYDAARIKEIFDAPVIVTRGFGFGKDKKLTELIDRLSQTNGVIILTDPDWAGMNIRNRLKSKIRGKVWHAYVPDVRGKERRKSAPSAEGKLGVEGLPRELIIEAVRRSGAMDEERPIPKRDITPSLLYELGLSGGEGSKERRERLKAALGLPERLGPGALLDVLNAVTNEEELRRLASEGETDVHQI